MENLLAMREARGIEAAGQRKFSAIFHGVLGRQLEEARDNFEARMTNDERNPNAQNPNCDESNTDDRDFAARLRRMISGPVRRLTACLLLLSLCCAQAQESNKVQRAKLKVSGFGLIGNRELKKTIRLMSGKKAAPEFYDANFVEDAALIIMSSVDREGYLAPRVTATLTLADGKVQTFKWDKDIDTVLPGPLAVKKVRFRVRRGVRYYYRKLAIHGLKSPALLEARALFIQTGFLVSLKSTRIYAPSRLDRSVSDLTETLARKGF